MDDYLRFLRSKVGHARLVLPAVGIFALDSSGRLLLQRRRDNGKWAQPGGYMQPGEDTVQAACREALEETGFRVEVTGLLGLYTHPEHFLIRYPNGDEVQVCALEFEGRVLGEVGGRDDEALEVAFFAPDALPPEDALNPFDLPILRDFLSSAPRPFLR